MKTMLSTDSEILQIYHFLLLFVLHRSQFTPFITVFYFHPNIVHRTTHTGSSVCYPFRHFMWILVFYDSLGKFFRHFSKPIMPVKSNVFYEIMSALDGKIPCHLAAINDKIKPFQEKYHKQPFDVIQRNLLKLIRTDNIFFGHKFRYVAPHTRQQYQISFAHNSIELCFMFYVHE